MRSRYAAFARRDYPYLWRTLHPRHEDRQATRADWLASVRRSSASLRFEGLRVCGTRGPDAEGLGHVLFHATLSEGGLDRSFAEHSRFALDGSAWRYLDGTMLEWQDPGDLTFDSFWRVALR